MPTMYNLDLYDGSTENRCVPISHITMVRPVQATRSHYYGGTKYWTNQLAEPHSVIDGEWQGVGHEALYSHEPFEDAVQRFEKARDEYELWLATAKEG